MRILSLGYLLSGLAAGVVLMSVPAVRNLLPFNRADAPPVAGAAHGDEREDAHDEAAVVNMTPERIAAQGIAVVEAGPGVLPQSLTAYGTIAAAANRVARVPARVVGTVADMRRQLGDRVEKGEIVAMLDSREVADAKGEYLTAAVNAELQRTNFERSRALRDKGIASESVYLQALATNSETGLRLELARQKLAALGLDANVVAHAAKTDRENATSSLRQYELRAPLSGQIIERRADVGMTVGKEGDPSDLYTIADLGTVWVELAVPTADIEAVKLGAAVSVAAGPSRERAETGRVIFISPVLNPDTRSARVIAELPNGDGRWRPGAFVRADIDVGRADAAVLAPRAAAQTMNGESVVFVRTGEGFARRDVKLGRASGDFVEILSGLAAGEAVAAANSFLLKAELGKAGAAHSH